MSPAWSLSPVIAKNRPFCPLGYPPTSIPPLPTLIPLQPPQLKELPATASDTHLISLFIGDMRDKGTFFLTN